jgi:hypothetical protein
MAKYLGVEATFKRVVCDFSRWPFAGALAVNVIKLRDFILHLFDF